MAAREIVRRVAPRALWVALREARVAAIFALRRLLLACGLNVSRRRDCYSPLPVVPDLARNAARWNRPSRLAGVRYDLDAMEARLGALLERHQDEFRRHPSAADVKARAFGPGFPALDALVLYAMLREHRPARYLEVGSGVSTFYARMAAAANTREGAPTAITCVEPRPYPALRALTGVELLVAEVQDVPLARFESLRANDVLFVDSSHVVRIDGDVPFLFLEVLPRLAPGVFVHVHDIPFPYNVPHPAAHWVLDPCWPMFWNEAMLLQAFLAHNDRCEIWLSAPLIRHLDEEFLEKSVAGYQPVSAEPDTFSSIWLRVRGS